MFGLLWEFSAQAQIFGGDPARLRWQQVNTSTVRVIFPEGMEDQAQRITALVTNIDAYHRQSMSSKLKKLNIVLQNQTILSNGYVMLAPFRAEFQTTPPQQMNQLGSLPWLDYLTVHEYRHALQNMYFNVGISHLMRIAFGEAGQAFATDVAIPNWFWEGDAVFTETAFTPQGRGRLPSFFDAYRALAAAHFPYSWMKLRNGSYRDDVPNHYPLGYLLCAYGREKYGDSLWAKVTHDAAAYKHLFYPFSHALHDYTGKRVIPFYHDAMQYYSTLWKQDRPATLDQALAVFPDTISRYLNQDYPVFVHDSLLFVQNSFKRVATISMRDTAGHVHRLIRPGIVPDLHFTARNGYIVWVGYRNDPRWGWKDYGVLMVYNIHHHRIKKITHRTKLFSPALSSSGDSIVAVSISPQQKAQLCIFQTSNGSLIDTFTHSSYSMIAYPQFSVDGKSIYYIAADSTGKSGVVRQNLIDEQVQVVLPFSYHPLQKYCITRDWLFFSGSYESIQQIYALSLSSGVIYRVTSGNTGCYSPAISPDQHWLIYSQFTLKGRRLMKLPLDSTQWTPLNAQKIDEIGNAYAPKAIQEEQANVLQEVHVEKYSINRYPKAFQLIHVHSWEPLFNDPDIGFQILSDNILNTCSSSLYYVYNRNEYSHTIGSALTYGGWYSIWQLQGQYIAQRSAVNANLQRVYWNESTASLTGEIPLNFSGRMFYRMLLPLSTFHYTRVQYPAYAHISMPSYSFQYFTLGFQFLQQRIQAQKQVAPHIAQYIQLNWSHSLGKRFARQLYLRADLYFPGIWPTHSLLLQGALQQKDTSNQYNFADHFIYARGYNLPYYNKQVYRFSINYQLPIAYPDWGFAGIMYLLRLRLNGFYDYSQTTYFFQQQNYHQYFRSLGLELNADTRWWNEYPLSITLRFSHLLDTDPVSPAMHNRWELIIPLQIN